MKLAMLMFNPQVAIKRKNFKEKENRVGLNNKVLRFQSQIRRSRLRENLRIKQIRIKLRRNKDHQANNQVILQIMMKTKIHQHQFQVSVFQSIKNRKNFNQANNLQLLQ
jgi:hypothetical protein